MMDHGHIEEDRHASEKEYRALFESSRDAIMMLDSGGFFDCNKATLGMFRFVSKEQFILRHPADLSPEFQPNGQKSSVMSDGYIQAALKEGWQFFEWTHCRLDGTLFVAEVLLGRFEFREKSVLQAVVRDITERKASENALKKAYTDLKNMQDQLLQSEKMATVGQLAAGVAHEINNPAGFVMSNLDTLEHYVEDFRNLLEKYAETEPYLKGAGMPQAALLQDDIDRLKQEKEFDAVFEDLPHLIKESQDGMKRIKRIVADLRTFSHTDAGLWEEADIHELIQSALNIAWNEIKYKAEVVKEYADIPRIRCYPQQLSQVFLNLFVNAVQAISEKGTIAIRTYVDGDMVVVKVIDNGCGMSEDVCRHVFEPFFTTKPVGQGTGLGLSLAYNIIEKHKGKIDVTSRPREGSVFTIRLPKGM